MVDVMTENINMEEERGTYHPGLEDKLVFLFHLLVFILDSMLGIPLGRNNHP